MTESRLEKDIIDLFHQVHETFDPGGNLPDDCRDWEMAHHGAIEAVRIATLKVLASQEAEIARLRAEHDKAWEYNAQLEEGIEAETLRVGELETELQRWRGWAQFVYQRGGPITMNDAEQRSAVCQAHDADRDELKTQIGELETEIAACRKELSDLRVKLSHLPTYTRDPSKVGEFVLTSELLAVLASSSPQKREQEEER